MVNNFRLKKAELYKFLVVSYNVHRRRIASCIVVYLSACVAVDFVATFQLQPKEVIGIRIQKIP